MCHKQPRIEKHLRDQIVQLGIGKMQLGSEVNSIREDSESVYVGYTDSSGATHTVQGKFLVGADGKTGYTRKRYLEAKGIELLATSSTEYEKDWVALNWHISLPTPTTHPDFPLWRKGYTPEQVYDEYFPSEFRFLCNHARPAVCGRFGLQTDRLWRFEFVVLDDEDSLEMATPAKISQVVHPYITHSGKRYGLTEKSIMYPLDCIEVWRCRPFRFSARSCNKWSLDRVMLCGDAAHVFPPFGGQGIASGFRDAISLAWRLRLATEKAPNDKLNYSRLFEGWYSERKQQLEKSLALTVENGERVNQSNLVNVFLRDWMLWLIQFVPSWRKGVESAGRDKPLFRYKWEDDKGMAFLPSLGGGRNFVQAYAAKVVAKNSMDAEVLFTDDLIFNASKKALFQLVVIIPGDGDTDDLDLNGLLDVEEKSGGAIQANEVTVIANSIHSVLSAAGKHPCYRLATAEEFANHPSLCAGRPVPVGFDPYRMTREVQNRKFVILRPDRVVFAACDDMDALLFAAEKLRQFVSRGQLLDVKG